MHATHFLALAQRAEALRPKSVPPCIANSRASASARAYLSRRLQKLGKSVYLLAMGLGTATDKQPDDSLKTGPVLFLVVAAILFLPFYAVHQCCHLANEIWEEVFRRSGKRENGSKPKLNAVLRSTVSSHASAIPRSAWMDNSCALRFCTARSVERFGD